MVISLVMLSGLDNYDLLCCLVTCLNTHLIEFSNSLSMTCPMTVLLIVHERVHC